MIYNFESDYISDIMNRSRSKMVNKRRPSTSSSNSSGHRKLARFVSQAAGGLAGFEAAGIPGAFQGAANAGEVFDFATGLAYPEQEPEDAAVNVYPNNSEMTKYGGRFRKPSYRTKTIEGEYAAHGYVQRRETNGVMSDPHCFYVGHSTWDVQQIAGTLCGALLRKVLQKAGIPINDRDVELPVSNNDLSTGMEIVFCAINDQGVVATVDNYVTADNAGLTNVIQAFVGMNEFFQAYMKNEAEQNRKPYCLLVYLQDRYAIDGTSDKRLAAKLDLESEIIDLHIQSGLIVQNRSAAALGATTTTDIDRSDTIPLKGRIYEFRNADPRLRVTTAAQKLITHIPIADAILVRAAELGADWQDVPPPKYFSNCVKSVAVKLPVGMMKKSVLSHKFKGTLFSFIQKFRCSIVDVIGAGGEYVSGIPAGKCVIIGFEEQMRTAKNNPIRINYERQLVVGVKLRTRKPAPLKVGLTVTEKNNNP